MNTGQIQNFTTLGLQKERALRVLEAMHRCRFMDEKMAKLVRQNKGGTFALSMAGHEMIGAASAIALQAGVDWGFPYYRDRAFAIGLGCCLTDLFGSFLARDTLHHSGGRMMPDHFSQVDLRIPCQSSCVGSQYLQAVGLAKSIQLKGLNEVVYVSGGDGSTSQGDFHEALNFSAIHQLPLIFVVQDNGWAISVPVSEQTAGGTIAKMARGYEGLDVHEIDGCDYGSVTQALDTSVTKARSGFGPSLIVAKVPRIGAHSSSDDPKKYKGDTDAVNDTARDPIPRFENWLIEQMWLTSDELQQLRAERLREMELALEKAEVIPFPDRERAQDHVFKSFDLNETNSASTGESIVLMDALNHALVEEMERDSGVIVFGQDVAHGKGGVFGITRTLTDRFGKGRCFNTPLAESSIIGIAVGMSMGGMHRPVAEIQFCDYSWTGMNQLINEVSSIHYRSRGQWNCPIVIRMPSGGYIQGGPYHSQSIEAYLCHCPGLKVAIPSNAADAKRLLKAAIRDPNPVVFLEHKALYRQRLFSARPEPGSEDLLPFGKAHVVRPGSDVTFVGWGMTILMGNSAAEELAKKGHSVEVIDLRTLSPLDFDTVLTSLKKTGKLLIAHEAARNCGFGAELAARALEEGFRYLDAPVVRVTGKDCPVPYCKDLEEEILPQQKEIVDSLEQLINY